MTERPAWLTNRIANLILERNRDRAALDRVQVVADNPHTPPAVREALLRALNEGHDE